MFEPLVSSPSETRRIWELLELPERILTFDCETTGLDSKVNRVIELGMVWVTADGVETCFDSLFHHKKVPSEITRLTGISTKMLANAPEFAEKLDDIEQLWNTAPAFLGHSLVFDVGFLIAESTRCGKSWPLPLWLLDTRNFARLLFPEAPPGGLGGFSEWLHLKHDNRHRALSDAQATGELFRACLPRLMLLSKEECDALTQLATQTRYGFPADLWRRLRPHLRDNDHRSLPASPWPPAFRKSDGEDSVPPAKIADELSTNGYASKQMPTFRQRNGQLEYAERLTDTLNNHKWSVLEAGTGVGKTFGYLVPLLSWLAEDTSRRAVISTYSKTLQHRLFHKDLPFWLSRFKGIEVALLKGRTNYICPFRFTDLSTKRTAQLTPDEAYHASTLPLWLAWSNTGDISELVTLREGSAILRKVASDPYQCGALGCPNANIDCFFAKARKRASSAQLVVVNHALLCNYLFFQPQLLGDVNAFVIDEAHRLEEVARDATSVVLSRQVLKGLTETFTDLVAALPIGSLGHEYKEAQRFVAGIEEMWMGFVHAFQPMMYTTPDTDFGRRKRYLPGDGPAKWQAVACERFEQQLLVAVETVKKWKSTFPPIDDTRTQIESFEGRLGETGAAWQRIRIAPNNTANWWELAPDTDPNDVLFYSSPVDVSPSLHEKLFIPENFGILTSATLSVGDSFSYFRNAIGLRDDTANVEEHPISSPFKLKQQLRVAVPMFGIDPWESNYFHSDEVAEWLAEALHESNVNTMVLATSRKVGLALAKSLQSFIHKKDGFVWLQGRDGNPAELVELFRGKSGGILIGYDSFWEGVDLPGTALEAIVIPRLPFPVPDDPIQAAKADLVRSQGGNDFYDVSIPQAILKLKQGIGRMIRQENDKGIILILDRRILTARYGEYIRRALPVEVTPLRNEGELLDLFAWLKT